MEFAESAPAAGHAAPADAPLDTVEICTGPEPNAAVIWLHGLGADGHDFEPVVPHLQWPGMGAIRYVFPHAPVRPVTINGGMPMRAWYDITAIDADRGHDQQGIADSVRAVTALVQRERERGIGAHRIVVAGFSQGGAIAMQLALRYPERLAGLIFLSSYLLSAESLSAEAHAENRDLPVFAAHGSADPVVPAFMGEAAVRQLEALGYPVEWHRYDMPHAVCPEQISDIAGWLRQQLG